MPAGISQKISTTKKLAAGMAGVWGPMRVGQPNFTQCMEKLKCKITSCPRGRDAARHSSHRPKYLESAQCDCDQQSKNKHADQIHGSPNSNQENTEH